MKQELILNWWKELSTDEKREILSQCENNVLNLYSYIEQEFDKTHTVIQDGDRIYTTGAFLIRDSSVNGGWVLGHFEDDSYFGGNMLESFETDDGIIYYTN